MNRSINGEMASISPKARAGVARRPARWPEGEVFLQQLQGVTLEKRPPENAVGSPWVRRKCSNGRRFLDFGVARRSDGCRFLDFGVARRLNGCRFLDVGVARRLNGCRFLEWERGTAFERHDF